MIELSQINIYPVKSCKGISLTRSEVVPLGLKNDRRWMAVDPQGNFLSQRCLPRMALIEPAISSKSLMLKAPDFDSIEIPLQADLPDLCSVRIWDDVCTARDCGEEVAKWLTEFLETKSRLVTMGDEFNRIVDANYSQNRDQVSFADAFPLLLISSASLRDLNERLDHPVPMNRFRPNLVVSGCDPYAEDQWSRISVGGLIMYVCKPCSRCATPTVDQSTGMKGSEPLATLATYRKGVDNKVFFGQNLINEQKAGELVLGMEVSILGNK